MKKSAALILAVLLVMTCSGGAVYAKNTSIHVKDVPSEVTSVEVLMKDGASFTLEKQGGSSNRTVRDGGNYVTDQIESVLFDGQPVTCRFGNEAGGTINIWYQSGYTAPVPVIPPTSDNKDEEKQPQPPVTPQTKTITIKVEYWLGEDHIAADDVIITKTVEIGATGAQVDPAEVIINDYTAQSYENGTVDKALPAQFADGDTIKVNYSKITAVVPTIPTTPENKDGNDNDENPVLPSTPQGGGSDTPAQGGGNDVVNDTVTTTPPTTEIPNNEKLPEGNKPVSDNTAEPSTPATVPENNPTVPAVVTPTAPTVIPTQAPVTAGNENNIITASSVKTTESTVIEDEEQPLAQKPQTVTIEETAAPLAAGKGWALINLICAVITEISAMMVILKKEAGKLKIASIADALAAVVLFFLTEDMATPMILTDKWTLLMALLTAVMLLIMLYPERKEQSAK